MAERPNPRGFMKIEGVKIQGDSKAKDFEGQTIVLDLSFSVMQAGRFEKERGSIMTNLSEVSVRTYVGAQSAELLQACAKKVPLTKVTIVMMNKVQLTLEDALITNVSLSMGADEEYPTGAISMSYRKVEWLSWTEKVKGTGSFDVILNELE